MKRLALGLATLALLFVAVGQVRAGTISSLYNTGVNASGMPLPDGTLGDPHYSLISVPSGTTNIRVKTSASGYPVVANIWLGDNALSAWIGPYTDSQLNGPIGHYTYRTTFDLTGFDPLTASISGQWATDNQGIGILINGTVTGNTIPDPTGGAFNSWHAFSITSGFVSGVNTLDFVVNNDGGPTGLRVEMTGTATAPIPEPASIVMLGLGAVGLLGYSWRRRKTVVA